MNVSTYIIICVTTVTLNEIIYSCHQGLATCELISIFKVNVRTEKIQLYTLK